MNFMDIFNDDAFSLTSLTAAINNEDHVPGRAGELVFRGVSEGVPNLTVALEVKDEGLTLIPTTPRGAPAPKEVRDKAKLIPLSIPQIKLEETIMAHSIQGVRQFGSTDVLAGVQAVVNGQLSKMAKRHDLTLEYHRLGALKGIIRDADGSVLLDLFERMGVTQEEYDALAVEFVNSEGGERARITCHEIVRKMHRNAKTVIPSGARVWAFCGDEFFDAFIEFDSVKEAYLNSNDQERRIGGNYAFGTFEFAGVVFENYRGTDNAGDEGASEDAADTVMINSDEAIFFLTGVPGLYAEYLAPADFMETVNTIGLPRYARQAVDTRFSRFVELHTQQNPLPICLRPKTLMRATIADL